ncbi:MAG: hypothetical protein PHH71_03540 [Clostridia bacterium]|jgi:hypothetical protein|nr:hypothetical protein [Clostridia bacterium]MDD3232135.1 hypothetical protein [Clostridia bacterium]MDD3862945.1 hypothetical protein [Clostridia bacterium]MDD4408567.1 hypothetical protein [Clostridia bacterium]
MRKLEKNLKIVRLILYFLTALFLLLQFAWQPFLYFALISLVLIFIDLSVLELYKYSEVKTQIKINYEIYLVECYNAGKISKEQLDAKDRCYFQEYSRQYRLDKLRKILFFLLWFGLAVALLIIVLQKLIG